MRIERVTHATLPPGRHIRLAGGCSTLDEGTSGEHLVIRVRPTSRVPQRSRKTHTMAPKDQEPRPLLHHFVGHDPQTAQTARRQRRRVVNGGVNGGVNDRPHPQADQWVSKKARGEGRGSS
jgi:hypothetical protein